MSKSAVAIAEQPVAVRQPVTTEKLVDDPFRDKTIFGFWVYLMTDCVLFATLFATYAVLHNNTSGGPGGRELFSLPYVLVETLLLLTSSFTCGLAMLAVHKAADEQAAATRAAAAKAQIIFWFGVTFLLGAAFLGMELSEFTKLAHEGNSWRASGFLSGFFTLVGTHGLHITSGLVWMAVLITKLVRSGLTLRLVKRLTLLSLFWHLLDVVWIFIFSVVYLLGAA